MTASLERRVIPRYLGPEKTCPCAQGGLGRLRCALGRAAPEPVEVLSGALALVWGMWLLFVPQLFQVGLTYHLMRDLAPQPIWGTVVMGCGLLQFLSLVYGNPKWRRRSAVYVGAMWFWLSIILFLGAPGLVAGPLHMLFAVACFWCWRRHRANARES